MFKKITEDFYLKLDEIIAIEFNIDEIKFVTAGEDGFTTICPEEDVIDIMRNYLEKRSDHYIHKLYKSMKEREDAAEEGS